MSESGGRLIDGLYYEISIRADGMESGKAKSIAVMKQIEAQAEKTGAAIDRIGSGNPNVPYRDQYEARKKSIRELNDAFRAGTIDQAAYEKAALALGVKLKTVSEVAKAAAVSVTATATSTTATATAATVAATGVSRFSGLLGLLAGPAGLGVAASIAIGFIVKKLQAVGDKAREAKAATDALIGSLLKQRAAERPETVKAEELLKEANAALAARRARLAEAKAGTPEIDRFGLQIGTGVVVDSKKVAAAQLEVTRATQAQEQAQRKYNDALKETDDAHARRLSNLVREGVASQQNRVDLANLGREAREELKLLAAATTAGTAARQALITGAFGDPTAVERRREQLAGILSAANEEAERQRTASDKSAKAEERERAAQERKDAAAARKGDAAAEARQRARQAFDTAIAGRTPQKEDNLEAQIASLTNAATKAGLGAIEIAGRVAALRAAVADSLKEATAAVTADLNAQLVAQTVTLVDDLKASLDAFDKEIAAKRKAGTLSIEGEKSAEGLRAARVDTMALTEAAERLAPVLERIRRDTEEGFGLKDNLAALQPLIEAAQDARNAAPEGSTKQAAAQARLDDLLKQELEIRKRIKALQTGTLTETQKFVAQTAELAGKIGDAANAAFGLASAFLGVDNSITKALGSIGQLSGGISSALKATSLLGAIPGIGQAIGGAIALASSLFGKDPAITAARKETLAGMKSLQGALLELKDVYLQNVSSDSIKRDIANAERVISLTGGGTFNGKRVLQPGEGSGAGRRDNLRDIGSSFGKDFDSGALLAYFKELDRRYNTNLASFIEREDPAGLLKAIAMLPKQLKEELGELGRFGDDAAGVMARINYEFDVLGKSDPLAKFLATVKALQAAKIDLGDFADELNELADSATTSERVQEIIASVLAQLAAGGANLGGLSAEEIRALLSQGADARRSASGGTGGFTIDRSITEVTGSRIGAMLTNVSAFTQQTAQNTAQIVALLGGRAISPGAIGAPPISSSSSVGGSVGGVLTVQVSPGAVQISLLGSDATPDRALEFGGLITDAVIREIDRKVGALTDWKRRANGDLTVY